MSNVSLPEKLGCLFDPCRYKILKGGRAGGKSWGVAIALLLKGTEKSLRILCTREYQNSIKDSVHQLLQDQITLLGLQDFYEVQNTVIIGRNGTRFGFEGLKHNIVSIKSWEGADICWVEEAQTVSKTSWDTLIPTIRKENSEIWITFNPELEEDETYQHFVLNPPKESIVVTMTFRDNPWFPDVLEKERLELLERDPVAYDNIWEGNPRTSVEGAIFSHEIHAAQEEGRICNVPYDLTKPVDTYWDLGHSDATAIWFAQMVGLEHRILRYYSNSHMKMNHYLQYLQSLPYVYGTHYLPHDAANEQLGQDRTIEQQARAILKRVVVIPRVPKKANAIEAARVVFPHCYFDRELCSDGLTCLRRYSYHCDPETGKVSKEPEHDMWSHGSDAWLSLGMAMAPERARPERRERQMAPWMKAVGVR